MASIELSGLLVQPVVRRVSDWAASGKLDEDDLERALSSDARVWLDHSLAEADWAPLADVEGLVGLVSTELGGETGLVEWADEIVADWLTGSSLSALMDSARRLADGPGFIASHASERLVRSCGWRYDGSPSGFSVHVCGVGEASPSLKALLGACLAKLAAAADARDFDTRFEGVDGDDLLVFGEVGAHESTLADSRLHRAALIP